MAYHTLNKLYESRGDAETAEYDVDDKTGKIIATLKSYDSAKYTKLGKDLERISELSAEIQKLQAETKASTKMLIADIFDAEDIAFTRVVETVSYVFTLTKNPKATETYAYGKILEELEKHLTPSLVKVLEQLKKKHKSTVQKAPALSYHKKGLDEAFDETWVAIRSSLRALRKAVTNWGHRYDHALNRLKVFEQQHT